MSVGSIILRSGAPKRVMTFELKRRGSLSPLEAARFLGPVLAELGLWGMFAAGLATGNDALGIVGMLLGITFAVVGFFLLLEEDLMGPSERRFQILAGRSRAKRAHRAIERTRLRSLRRSYTRYSVWVERDGMSIVVSVLKHQALKWGLFLRWQADKQRRGYDAVSQSWQEASVARWVPNAEPDSVMQAVEAAQAMAEAMEEASYQEALKLHKLDALANAHQPPPLGGRKRDKVLNRLSD